MKTHLRRIIWPITVTAALLGCALFEYPLGKPRRFLSFLWATVMCGTYVAICLMSVIWFSVEDNIHKKSVSDFMMVWCCPILLLSIWSSHWNGKKYHTCLERFNQADETLRGLGIQTDYTKLHRVATVGVFIWVSVYILIASYNCKLSVEDDWDDNERVLTVFLTFVVNIPPYAPMIILMHFCAVLRYAGIILDYSSGALSNLVSNGNDCTSWYRNRDTQLVPETFVPDERSKRIIWTLMHLQFELYEILGRINRVFEPQITNLMGIALVYILTSVIYTIRMIQFDDQDENQFVIGGTIWIMTLPYLVGVIATNHFCENISAKATTICDKVVELLRLVDDEILRDDLALIVLRTKHTPLRFSSIGLEHFGYQYMYQTCNSMVMMVIIVFQKRTPFER